MESCRLHERVPFVGKITVTPDAGQAVSFWGSNLSASGVFLQTNQSFPVGSRVALRFTVDGQEIKVCSAEVSWVRPFEPVNVTGEMAGFGVCFLQVEPRYRALLLQHIDGALPGGATANDTIPPSRTLGPTPASPYPPSHLRVVAQRERVDTLPFPLAPAAPVAADDEERVAEVFTLTPVTLADLPAEARSHNDAPPSICESLLPLPPLPEAGALPPPPVDVPAPPQFDAADGFGVSLLPLPDPDATVSIRPPTLEPQTDAYAISALPTPPTANAERESAYRESLVDDAPLADWSFQVVGHEGDHFDPNETLEMSEQSHLQQSEINDNAHAREGASSPDATGGDVASQGLDSDTWSLGNTASESDDTTPFLVLPSHISLAPDSALPTLATLDETPGCASELDDALDDALLDDALGDAGFFASHDASALNLSALSDSEIRRRSTGSVIKNRTQVRRRASSSAARVALMGTLIVAGAATGTYLGLDSPPAHAQGTAPKTPALTLPPLEAALPPAPRPVAEAEADVLPSPVAPSPGAAAPRSVESETVASAPVKKAAVPPHARPTLPTIKAAQAESNLHAQATDLIERGRVTIALRGGSVVRKFGLENPARVVIDVEGASFPGVRSDIIAQKGIARLRLGQQPNNRVRFVVELDREGTPTHISTLKRDGTLAVAWR